MGKAPKSKQMTKRERVEATLAHKPVDRCALLEQLSYNPRVIADWTGKKIDGFNYAVDDICEVISRTCDLVMPPLAPRGTARVTDSDGFVTQHDNWTGFCSVFDSMGLEIFTFFQLQYPDILDEFMKLSSSCELRRIHAVADSSLSPVILIPEDFATKQGPIFPPENFRAMVEAVWQFHR